VNGWRWLWMEMIRANCSSNSDTDAVSWLRIVSMLCVSTVFAVARCLSVRRPSVCLSVPLSSTWRKISSNFFDGSVIILVFLTPSADIQFQREPLHQGRKMHVGWENFAIFDWNRRLSRKRYEIGPWLLWNVNRKSYALYRMVTFSMTLTDP